MLKGAFNTWPSKRKASQVLLQLRTIKLLLVWALVVVPIIAVVAMVVLTSALEPDSGF